MDTETTRITRAEAAALAGVSQRTIHRWGAARLLTPQYGPVGSTEPATYDPAEVEAAAAAWKARILERGRPSEESDIST